MATYIIIEIPERDNNALDIMNILMTQTKARFTITQDIGEYAAEREKLRKSEVSKRTIEDVIPTSPDDRLEPPSKKSSSPVDQKPDIQSLQIPKLSQEFQQVPEIPTNFQFDDVASFYLANSGFLPTTSSMMMSTSSQKLTPKRQNDSFRCQVCGTMIKAFHMDFYKRSNHAICHTDLMRYICPIESCGIKTRHRSNIVSHARTVHGLHGKFVVKNCLHRHEDEQLKQMVLTCFPEMEQQLQIMARKGIKKCMYLYADEYPEGDGEGCAEEEENNEEEQPNVSIATLMQSV